MNDKQIEMIYNANITAVLNGIEEKYVSNIKDAYLKYLTAVYLNINLMGTDSEDAFNFYNNLEGEKWKKISPMAKLTKLYIDVPLNEIKNISIQGFKYALERINNPDNKIDQNIAEECISKLSELLSQVQDFNQRIAREQVSEGCLDYSFASGKSDAMSLRIARSK